MTTLLQYLENQKKNIQIIQIICNFVYYVFISFLANES